MDIDSRPEFQNLMGPEAQSPRPDPARVRCPKCQSRLDVLQTPSGAVTISVYMLGQSVETSAKSLEIFLPRSAGAELQCPACESRFDPAGPRPIPRLRT